MTGHEPWLASLRERKPRGISGERGVQADIAQWELLALLDIAEAAQECRRLADVPAADYARGEATVALMEALDRAENSQEPSS